ncbi:MAG TPA: serine/threonine-protein kinase [Kofleriaceae bacterium]
MTDDELAEPPTIAEPVAAAVERRSPSPTAAPSLTASGSFAGSRSSGSITRAGATTIGSPLLALERDELLRTRWFCLIALGMVIGGGASVLIVPGDPTAAKLLVASVAVAITGIVFLYRRTSDLARFRNRSTLVAYYVLALTVLTSVPFFGGFSPVVVLFFLAVYFIGLGSSARLATAVWLTCAVGQAVIAGLVIAGLRDPGLVDGGLLDTRVQVLILVLVEMVLACTFGLARLSRRASLLAVGELERAIRVGAQREAQLLEAREELDRALRVGRGRFSEQVIAGYELGDVIGRGAMGEVYAATDPRDGSPAAIKLLSSASLGNPDHIQRFFRELSTAVQIRSPHVVRVIEIGERPVPYLVMERLDGKNLAEILRGRRKLSVARVVELVAHVGEGLAAAAAAGVIHRDIKPHNLFHHQGAWKILDFGVARFAEHGDTLTSGQIVGTPAYMSPEQARGDTVDPRTDLYALAAVAYRALTGQPPFAAREVADTLYRVVHTAPTRPSRLVSLPRDVELVLAIGLAKRAADRFANSGELVAAFAAAAGDALAEPLRDRARALEAGGAWA